MTTRPMARTTMLGFVFVCCMLRAGQVFAQNMTSFTPEELHRRTVERRAVDAVIWGLPPGG